ncbi:MULTISPECIES: response regulator transcription factor [Telluria group]|uniref:DNA-binding NarL/FixJ family response regulator n=1 Tax=Pseudoduganella violacea TaxID=1715466 RepID=A0A7W5B723_9BURK|nr:MULTISPECIES: response regulator transcription factor [Telluria group]AKU24280.1 LuxR family transcriptional regulator [Massilia sp. NR 4-1]MBB3117729.1 DNA-binding NarL/FixJ family response regulator [Pseudoduganella violacea]NVD98348.1 response regulator transcription factor [Massilia sp. BJB1822]UMR30724.1 response regulator transcription factor [Massilia sp. MB5]UTY58298.1 response regulator transcription factor [Massilia sp. erpn]
MSEKAVIKVFIADDHAIVREGLKQILADTKDIVVAGEAENGLDAVKLFRKSGCQVLLLDISMPDRSGIEVLKQVKKEKPELAVLMLSMHREDQYAIRSLKAGAAGYLTKQSAPKELVTAIRQVASGLKYISPALAQELANHVGEDHEAALHESLSDREYQTLTMIASGKTVGTIAKELSLSVKTVSEYRARLLVKMKLKNSAELTHYAIKNQLIE